MWAYAKKPLHKKDVPGLGVLWTQLNLPVITYKIATTENKNEYSISLAWTRFVNIPKKKKAPTEVEQGVPSIVNPKVN